MRIILTCLLISITTQTYAATALECREGKKWFSIFIQTTPTIPLPKRFIFDPEKELFLPQNGEWVSEDIQFSETEVTAIFHHFYDYREFYGFNFKDVIFVAFDRFTGGFSIDATTYEKHWGINENFTNPEIDKYPHKIKEHTSTGYCRKVDTKF